MEIALLVLLGVVAGVLSGLFGIGGGIVIVPALVMFGRMDLKHASAVSLGALLLPVGILAAHEYYREGYLKVSHSLFIAVGLLFGALGGAKIAMGLEPVILKRIWGIFLVLVGLYYLVFESMVKEIARRVQQS